MPKVRRVLISVSDKSGIVEFARGVESFQAEILSTGGTARTLGEAGIAVRDVSDYTGFPEMMDGRVKTLHPAIHAGLLARRDHPDDMRQLTEMGLATIDMVVVNLYPFEQTVAKDKVSLDEAIENIDIGGPTMLRAAAKNYAGVAVVTSPEQYRPVLEELRKRGGEISEETCQKLALEVFRLTSRYDTAVRDYLADLWGVEEGLPEDVTLRCEKVADLRYGENPHQKAAFYRVPGQVPSLADARQLGGKELSYNNLMDLDAAIAVVREFREPAGVLIKHTNPCGAAVGKTLAEAYRDGLACDPLSAFGSLIALNREVDMETARLIHDTEFVEAVIAPGYAKGVAELLTKKKNRRIMELASMTRAPEGAGNFRQVLGGLLLQDFDAVDDNSEGWRAVTKREPTRQQMRSLAFAWKVMKHVKSNAILLAQGTKTVGIGAGQMSRVDSVIIAVRKAGPRAKGSVLVSDAMFPKPDAIEEAARAGVGAIAQPGGAKEDEAVIAACDGHGIAMVMTGRRHFKH